MIHWARATIGSSKPLPDIRAKLPPLISGQIIPRLQTSRLIVCLSVIVFLPPPHHQAMTDPFYTSVCQEHHRLGYD